MTFVTIKEETEHRLQLSREPSAKAWAILIGIISLGIGAAYYSVDYMIWKMAYLSGAVFVGLSCMEDWEECTLDKSTGKLAVKRQSLIQKLFSASKGPKIVVAELDEAISVDVEEEDVRYSTKGYTVIVSFASGFSIGVTETAIIADRSEPEFIAEKIHKFLQLDGKKVTASEVATTPVSEGPDLPAEDGSTTSDDSFEQINQADLEMLAQQDIGQGDIQDTDLASEELEKD